MARQNPYVERLIGSIRRECLDHVVILNEKHLRRVLREYLSYLCLLNIPSALPGLR
jgi:hypothetical protein